MTDASAPRLLIADTTPLSLLSMIGRDALDWLFALGADVWLTDMVVEEASRDPDPGADPRRQQRAALREWLAENANRLRILPTLQGADYRREMRNWVGAGSVPEDKPSWRNRGEASVAEIIPLASSFIQAGDKIVFLVDDRAARALIVAAVQTGALDADIMATQTFLAILDRDLDLIVAGTAWQAVSLAARGDVPVPYNPDPIIIRAARR